MKQIPSDQHSDEGAASTVPTPLPRLEYGGGVGPWPRIIQWIAIIGIIVASERVIGAAGLIWVYLDGNVIRWGWTSFETALSLLLAILGGSFGAALLAGVIGILRLSNGSVRFVGMIEKLFLGYLILCFFVYVFISFHEGWWRGSNASRIFYHSGQLLTQMVGSALYSVFVILIWGQMYRYHTRGG